MAGTPHSAVEVDGRSIKVTTPDRMVYPEDGITKVAVIAYYVHVAETLLPHLRRRPVTRIRWPGGVAEERFFEKQLPSSAPEWIERITIEHSDGPVTYPFAHEAATLAWFAQQNALELHVPQGRAFGSSRRVDRLVFDLDPGPGRGLTDCAEVAFWLKERLDDAGMSTVPVTSGSKGLHLYARWKQSGHGAVTTSEFAKSLAEDAARAMPSLATPVMAKAERSKKVLIDWSQNNPNKTTITPYSLRGREHPWVAAPRTWDEMEDPGLRQLLMAEVIKRVQEGDPFAALV